MVRIFDAGDEEQVAKRKEWAARVKAKDDAIWAHVLNTYEGRYIVNYILEEMARPFELSFNPDNSRLTDFREGERNVGNQLIARAFSDHPSLFNLMRDEYLERKKGDN